MQFHIEDMSCGGCVANISEAIESADAQAKVEADLGSKTITVESALTEEVVITILKEAGYPAS